MIAYNQQWLSNMAVRDEIDTAFEEGTISKEEKIAIETAYPVGFYSPNYFIRIGLLILTFIIAAFSLGLLCLIMMSALEKAATGILIFFALVSYAALEFFVRKSNHYRSGVDDALLWVTAICLLSAVNIGYNVSASGNALIIFLLSTYFALRFADMLMTAIAVLSLLAMVFLNYTEMGAIAKATTSFILMIVTAAIYLVAKKTARNKQMQFYIECNIVIQITALVCFYAAANYFVVREVSNDMFGLNLQPRQTIPYGWLFWIFTGIIPVVYIARGLQKKDAILLRVGLLLVAAIVFTIRYYHAVWPIEQVMLLGGIALTLIAYILTRWLAEPKKGFTSAETKEKFLLDKMNVEALVIAETFGNAGAAPEKFGGGSFGGGGSSGEF